VGDMAASSDSAVVASAGGTPEILPDWELLPNPLLESILQKVSSDGSFPLPAALACKRWLGAAREG